MNVLSLFTGVGGIDLGLERSGFRIVGQCEADPAARRILERHWPGVPLSADVRGLDSEWLRSNGLQLADGYGPGSAIDRGIASPKQGTDPGGSKALRPEPNADAGRLNNGELERAGSSECSHQDERRRYESTGRIDLVCGGFPCQDLSVAGRRAGLSGDRSGLFFEATRIADLVLGAGGWLLIENVPGLFSSNNGRDFGVVLSTLAELGFHDLAWRVLDSRYFGVPQRRRRVFILARRARGDRAKKVLLEPESGGGNFAPSNQTRKGSTGAPRSGADGSIAPTLRANGGKDRNGKAGNRNASEDGTGRGTPLTASPEEHTGVRRLTPTECERLQGFPDGWTIPDETDWREYPKPDGPRYAQMGNAVTVNVAEWIGARLMEAESAIGEPA